MQKLTGGYGGGASTTVIPNLRDNRKEPSEMSVITAELLI